MPIRLVAVVLVLKTFTAQTGIVSPATTLGMITSSFPAVNTRKLPAPPARIALVT
jgi:hypothetical protein